MDKYKHIEVTDIQCSLRLARNSIQWGSENQTSPDFEWSISAGTGHLKSGPFENQTFYYNRSGFRMVITSLDCFIYKRVIKIIFFYIKRSSLAKFLTIRKPDTKWLPVQFLNG